MGRTHKLFKLLIIGLTVFFLFGYVVYPLWKLFVASTEQNNPIASLMQKQVLNACFNSFFLSVISVIGSAFVGTYFAYSFQYKKIFAKPFFSTLVLLPIAIPPMVGVMSYLFLLGDNGLLMKLFNLKAFIFSGWAAIIAIHIYSFYPLFYLFVGNTIKTIDSSIIEASYNLGESKFKTFYKIILPHLKPALLGASLLTFMASMASFSAPFIFGGSLRFLTTEIYYSKINGDTSLSAMLSILLAVISIIVFFCFKLYSKKIPVVVKTKGTAKRNALAAYRQFNYPATIASILFGIVIILPILALIIISLISDNSVMETGLHFNFSFKNFIALFANNDFLIPVVNSFKTSIVAIIITVVAGLSIAHLIRGKQNIFKSILETSASIPYGIPGTVIGICLILSFNQSTIFSVGNILVGTFWILPVAYTIRNLPIVTQAIKAGLYNIDTSIEEASNSLGASTFKTWRSVTLPLISTSIIEGAMLVFINSFGEFVATVLLYNYSTKTASIEVYSQMRLYNNSMAATFGVVLFIIVISIISMTRKITNKQFR